MNADNYKISNVAIYIENASNEIMEKVQYVKAKYETEPPHGDAIYSTSIKGGKVLPFWIYGGGTLLS